VRNRTITTIGVLLTASALAVTGCSSSKNKNSNGGGLGGNNSSSGNTANTTYKLGFIGALSGSNAQLGINEKQGVQLAVDQANSSGKYNFKISVNYQDSQGSGDLAKNVAPTLAQDPDIVGVIGPAFSGESRAVVGKFLCAANPPVPVITASASAADLSTNGWSCWHRIIPNDNIEGPQGADWLARTGAHKVFVLSDLSPYGDPVAKAVQKELQAKGVAVVFQGADGTTTTNYKPIAQQIKASGADALFYGGYDAQAAQLAKALDSAGFTGRKVTGNGGKSSVFTKDAGKSGDGWYFTCGCQDATIAPSAKDFAAAYKTKFNEDPSTYSPEAFDVANIYISVIDSLVKAGKTVDRTSILEALKTVDYKGITAEVKFQANGEPDTTNLPVNLFTQKNGAIVGVGDIREAK
jgi:branched-chain amino acid transport system substrate-binding protein